jgi:hypothetical protein
VRTRHHVIKGIGLGLILGWTLATIVTAGACTGVNPSFSQ